MLSLREQRLSDVFRESPPVPDQRTLGGAILKLVQLGQQLGQAEVLETSLQSVTEVAVQLTLSLQSSLRLLDESGKRLLTSARTGPSVHRRGTSPFRQGEGLVGWVAAEKKPVLCNDPAKDPRFVNRLGQKWTPSGIMAVPLISNQLCIGVLSCSQKNGIPYSDLDLNLLQLVAQLSTPYLEIARLKRLNESDPLTLLHNRRHLQDRLPIEIERSRRYARPLALGMIDIDHFKVINDSFGHDVGDEVLCDFANRLRRASRNSDILVRWGGEEFVCIFPETTLVQAMNIAERMRGIVCDEPFVTTAGQLPLSISLGVSTLCRNDDSQSLLQRADKAMYVAKHQGRNRTIALSAGAQQEISNAPTDSPEIERASQNEDLEIQKHQHVTGKLMID